MPTFEENINAPESMPLELSPYQDSPVVEQFRRDVNYWFVRYQNLYDRTNAAMRGYRFSHVELVTRIYNGLLTVYGDNIESIRQSNLELTDVIAERRVQLGNDNACLNGAAAGQTANSRQVGSTFNQCALYANTTMSRMLANVFYPSFVTIQNTISGLNVIVVDALSRGNALEDETAMIEYMRAGYALAEFQWASAVSQLLRWEKNRFEVDGLFLVDEMRICLAPAVVQYLATSARLLADARAC